MSGALFGRVIVVGLMVGLAAIGCGSAGSSGASGRGPGTSIEVPGVPSSAVPDSGVPSPGTSPPLVAWVPPGAGDIGPAAPDPPAARWRRAFNNHDCDAIAALGPQRGQVQLYTGLGDACKAVLQNNDRFWPAAEAALRRVGRPTDCLDRSALRVLEDLVATHRRAPHAKIHIVEPPAGRRCGSDDTSASPTAAPPGGAVPSPGNSTPPAATTGPSPPSH